MKSNFKAKMIFISELLLIGFVVFYAIFLFSRTNGFFKITVLFGVLLYHFVMRLFFNWFCKNLKSRPWNNTNKWFRERNFEKAIYKILNVNKWKDSVPNYDPEDFDVRSKKLSKIISNSCRVEVTHLVIIAFGFLPILLPLFMTGVGVGFWVLFWIGVVAAICEVPFVIVQRYNRPRMLKAFHNQESQRKEFYMDFEE